jgi:hypothetical protein
MSARHPRTLSETVARRALVLSARGTDPEEAASLLVGWSRENQGVLETARRRIDRHRLSSPSDIVAVAASALRIAVARCGARDPDATTPQHCGPTPVGAEGEQADDPEATTGSMPASRAT